MPVARLISTPDRFQAEELVRFLFVCMVLWHCEMKSFNGMRARLTFAHLDYHAESHLKKAAGIGVSRGLRAGQKFPGQVRSRDEDSDDSIINIHDPACKGQGPLSFYRQQTVMNYEP